MRKSSGLTTKLSRLTLGVLLALSGSASGASLEVDNGQITNIDTDVAYDAYLVGWYGTGVLNILAGGNASLTTITTSVIGANEDSEGTVNVLGGTWRFYDSGNNARPLNVGQSGTGTLNIKQKGHVDGGYLRIGSSTGGVGTVNVEGEDSVLTTELFEIGSYGTGSLNITDKGYVTSSIVAILGYQAGSNGQVVVEKGGEWLIKNNDSSIEFQIGNQGTGEATIREGGLITAENTIIGGNATGIRIGNDWCIPKGTTPTTHIIKLPIGEIRQPNATLDLSQSVDNEYYCLLLAKELGLNVPDAEIIKAGNVRALAVERFDRRWNAERTVLLRLPQEDMCQTFGLPSSVKYESDGGPGIARIMAFLMGSSEALKDRYDFMKFQVFQWLIGATDGHAKNFSVFIQAGGSYRLNVLRLHDRLSREYGIK